MTATKVLTAVRRWFDNEAGERPGPDEPLRVDWVRVLPFLVLHLGCLGVLWVGWSPVAVGVAVALYVVRMFAVTAFYHRYFSHRAFATSRFFQLCFAVLGETACQRGPLWWAAHHRHHHRHSDTEEDRHSPHAHGLFWSHVGWFTCRRNFHADYAAVPDLARYPELRFLDRFDAFVPLLFAASLYGLGALLGPAWGTSGWQMLVWGGISTVVLFHATCAINSLAHKLGRQRYPTGDQSRNSLLLALVTLGEGWHNNHHYYPGAARQGFRWWEIDLTYYGLLLLARVGVIRDLRPVPERVRSA